MACWIFGAGDFFGLAKRPESGDFVIAADGGWRICQKENIEPDLLLGDFDSLQQVPDFDKIHRVPVEKDDTDMMLAVKEGLQRGEREFYLYGGMGGKRTDHTVANFQTLLYLAHHDAQGWLYGNREQYTAIMGSEIVFPSREKGILSVFCMGETAQGVTISGGQYEVQNVELSPDFPLGVSNHFVGNAIRICVKKGSLLIGLNEEE